MAGFFFKMGQFLGVQSRKAGWMVRSLTGTAEEALRAEQAVGRDLARSILSETELDPDPAVARWLDEIGGILANTVQPRRQVFAFRALLMPQPNAFALPGGFIFVTRALLQLCQARHDDLAFVLGHEMGHVLRGHAGERMVAGSLLRTGVGLLRLPAVGLLATLLQKGYAQDQELEADREAVRLCAAAGFDPAAGVRLFEQLRLRLAGQSELAGYFATHPPWEVRLEQLRRLTQPR
jgi:beta-barrel assembly-enhancing protease